MMKKNKSGEIPVYKEKRARKALRQYFSPTSYTEKVKSPEKISSFIKAEDLN